MQQKGNTVSAPPQTVPFAACCCSRIFRVRGVVPLGMLIMYFPSISAVTRRRLVGTLRLSSSRRARAAGGGGGGEHHLGGNVHSGWGAGRPAKGTHVAFSSMCSHDQNPLSSQPPPRSLTEPSRKSGVWAQWSCRRLWLASWALCGSDPAPEGSPPRPARIPSDGKLLGGGQAIKVMVSQV